MPRVQQKDPHFVKGDYIALGVILTIATVIIIYGAVSTVTGIGRWFTGQKLQAVVKEDAGQALADRAAAIEEIRNEILEISSLRASVRE